MFNKQLYERICSVTCTEDELAEFCKDELECDTENPFDKYYSLESIEKCIAMYESKKVSDQFLAHWANLYNWIIMGGFKTDDTEKTVSLNMLARWEISDWLDSLSFYDAQYHESEEYSPLTFRNPTEIYKNSFRVFDGVYHAPNEWDVFYAHADDYGGYSDGGDICLLLVNKKQRSYLKLYSDQYDYRKYAMEGECCEEFYEEHIRFLEKIGFEEIHYGYPIDEDEE